MTEITITIVNRSRIARVGIAHLLNSHDNFSVISEHGHLKDAFEVIATMHPDIVIIDFPDTDGCRGINTIGEISRKSRIVVSGVSLSDDCVLACARAGADEYISSEGAADEWVEAINSSMQGLIRNPRIAGILNRYARHQSRTVIPDSVEQFPAAIWRVPENIEASGKRVGLTPRERQIMSLIDKGLSNKHIAKQLNVTPSTVKSHVHAILRKYKVHRRSEAAALFREAETSEVSPAKSGVSRKF